MTKQKHKVIAKLWKNPSNQLIAASLLFVLAAVLSRGSAISNLEQNVFFAFYDLPSWLHGFFYVVTQFGSIYVLGALLLAYLARAHYHIVIRLLMTGTLAYLLAGFCKSIVGRGRPHELLPDILTLDHFQGAGFPSGHVALAAALAITLAHYFGKKFYWVTAVWIAGVAASRMYLGVHLPLDIVGGIAIGWFSYALFRHIRLYDIRHHANNSSKTKLKVKLQKQR